MGFLLLLPLALFALIRLGHTGQPLRATLDAGVLFGAFTVVGCELLSLFSAYSLVSLLVFWLVILVGAAVLFRKAAARGMAAVAGWVRGFSWRRLGWAGWLMLAVLLFFLAGTLASALLYPPTLNYDSQTYHMPRVFFWMKNASVHNYATAVARQLHIGPFAEYCILQLQVLNFGRDWMANCVQWGSYLWAMLAVAGIARCLGAGRRAVLATALLCATVPLAVMQARTTQTDLVVASNCAVVVCYSVWFLRHRPQGRDMTVWAVFTGLAAGIAVLTKNTAFAVLLPFALLFLVAAWKGLPFKRLAAVAGIVLAGALCMNLAYMTRNALDLNGNFLATGLAEAGQFVMTSYSPRYRFVALVMNLLANLGSQSQFLSWWVDRIAQGVLDLTGVSMGDVAVFNNGTHFTAFVEYPSHDYAANPMHFALVLLAALLAVILFVMARRRRGKRAGAGGKGHGDGRLLLGYVLSCLAAFCLVGVMIKWSADGTTRYMLPALMLSLGFVAIPFQGSGFRRGFLSAFMLLAVLNASKSLLFDLRQPLIYSPRLAADMNTEQAVGWFSHSRDELRVSLLGLDDQDSYFALEAALQNSGAERIGLYESGGRAVYPCLAPLAAARYDVRYIEAAYHSQGEDPGFMPEAVIASVPLPQAPEDFMVEYHGRLYKTAAYSTAGDHCYLLLLPAG